MVPWILPKPSLERFPKNDPLFTSPGEAIGAPTDPNGTPKGHPNREKCTMDDLREPSERGPGKSSQIGALLDYPPTRKPSKNTILSSEIAMSLNREKVTKGLQNDLVLVPFGHPRGPKAAQKAFKSVMENSLEKEWNKNAKKGDL